MSRTPSAGMPATPVCQEGFTHPSVVVIGRGVWEALVSGFVLVPVDVWPVVQVPKDVLVEVVVFRTQLLGPPLPPTVSTR